MALQRVEVTYHTRRRQPAIHALRGIDLTIEVGQTVAMLGPNGSGKSTLMRVICGLLQPAADHGRVEVFGESALSEIRRAIGMVFQHTALDPNQTVHEALRDQAVLYGIPRAEAAQRVDADLDQSGLTDRRDQLIKTLSLGLARRVDLVRALLHRPRLLLLDEPTVGLDPMAREAFLQLIEDRRNTARSAGPPAVPLTVLLSTHLIDEADRQDRVILLHKGQLVADGTPAALRRQLGSLAVTVHDATWQPPPLEQPEEDGHRCWRMRAGVWMRPLSDDRTHVAFLAGELARQGVPYTIAPPTLADVFEHLTGSRLAAPSSAQREETAA